MKKGKTLFLIGLSLLIGLGVFSMSGCNKDNNKKESITLVEVYPKMEDNPLSITVRMNDSYTGTFTIDESTQILDIMQLLRNRCYYLQENNQSPAPLGNKTMVFEFEGGETYTMSTRSISYDGGRYVCNSDGLDTLLEEIGLEQGQISPK